MNRMIGRGRDFGELVMPGLLVGLLVGCTGEDTTGITPDACAGAFFDLRVEVPGECANLGYLVKQAARETGIEIILAPGTYEVVGDLHLKNDTLMRGEDPADPPILVLDGEMSLRNSVLRDVVVEGKVSARQSEVVAVVSERFTVRDSRAESVEAGTVRAFEEVELVAVTAADKLEMEGHGVLVDVVAGSGSLVLTAATDISGSVLSSVDVRPETEGRDRVDVYLSQTVLDGVLTVRGGTGGTTYVSVEDIELGGVVIASSLLDAGVEVEIVRAILSGPDALVDLRDSDGAELAIRNSLLWSAGSLLVSDSGSLPEDVEVSLHNNVLLGGSIRIEQEPVCGQKTTGLLSLRNNVFYDLDIALALVQDLEVSHNLSWGATCEDCRRLVHDGCGPDRPPEDLVVLEAEGSLEAEPGFEDLNHDDPSASDLHLVAGSPAIDAGVPEWSDPDGSRSDMGVYGGPEGAR